jgi:putative membrane protein
VDRRLAQADGRLAQNAETTKRAAEATAGAAVKAKTAAERATELAADRTLFAAERTYAAWVRTGLVGLASGIGSNKLLAGVVPGWMILGTGTVLLLFSAFCFGAGVWRQLVIGTAPAEPGIRRIPPVILAVVNGFLGLVALTALVGLWVGPAG